MVPFLYLKGHPMSTPKAQSETNVKLPTLAFARAATTESAVSHPWRYYIAGGAALQQIEKCIAEFGNAAGAYEDLAREVGAQNYDGNSFGFEFEGSEIENLAGNERVDFHLNGQTGQPFQCGRIARIPDFVVTNGRSYGAFYPDVATPRGKSIRDKCVALKEIAEPAARFARWLGSHNVKIFPDPHYVGDTKTVSAKAEKIGDAWIVAMPVVATLERGSNGAFGSLKEEWNVPPDSKPLAVSEYFTLLEKAGLLQNSPPAPAP